MAELLSFSVESVTIFQFNVIGAKTVKMRRNLRFKIHQILSTITRVSHSQGRNFGLKSGGSITKGERGALGSRGESGG